jgi:hypothetical protein
MSNEVQKMSKTGEEFIDSAEQTYTAPPLIKEQDYNFIKVDHKEKI